MRLKTMLRILSATTLCVSATLFNHTPVHAWSPPEVGKACPKFAGSGQPVTLIAGNYLGGKTLHAGVVDRASFQACFEDEQACSAWLAEKAITHPLQPSYARCTAVLVR